MITRYYRAAAAIAVVVLSQLGLRPTARPDRQSGPRTWRGRKTRRVLVTGASGFLGRAVIAAFADDGRALRAARARSARPAVSRRYRSRATPGSRPVVRLAPVAQRRRHGHPPCRHRARRPPDSRRDLRSDQSPGHRAAGCRRRTGGRSAFCPCVVDTRAKRTGRRSCADRARCGGAHRRLWAARSSAPRRRCDRPALPFTILRPAPVYGPGMKGGLASLFRAAVSSLAAAGEGVCQPALLSRHRQFHLRAALRAGDAGRDRRDLCGRRSGNPAGDIAI